MAQQRWTRLLPLLFLVLVLGQKCKLSTTVTKAPGVMVDRSPQQDGTTYESPTDCHWKISTLSANKVVQLDIELLHLDQDMYNDVLLINLGADVPVPQGWALYTRNNDITGQDYVGTFDYTTTVPGACTSQQGNAFDPMSCSLTDGTLMNDRNRDRSWIYFTGSGDGNYPITFLSMAPDIYIIFRSFSKSSSSSPGDSSDVSGLRMSYSFVSAYCDGLTVVAPRLDASDTSSLSTELQIKDNMAGQTKANMNCSWLIQPYRTPDGSTTSRVSFDSIWLDFRSFDIHGASIVSIYDGMSSQAPLLAQFIESNGPQDTIKAPHSAVYITYFTDDGPPSVGITIGWKASYCPNACSGRTHGTCILGMCDCNKGWAGAACNIPEGWLCAAAHYNAGDGCDCGCGLYDPDCGALDPLVVACTRSKSGGGLLYDGAMGRLFSGDCVYCPLPPVIAEQPKLPNFNWEHNTLDQSCPDVFQCPQGTQCSPTGLCTKVSDAAPPDFTLRQGCVVSTDCPAATVCNAQQFCQAPSDYALHLTSATTAGVCSFYGIPPNTDFTIELHLQVLTTPQGTDVVLTYPGLTITQSSSLTFTVGTSPPWNSKWNVADGLWHSIVWVWDNAAGTMSLFEVTPGTTAAAVGPVASTSGIPPGVVLAPDQNFTLGPLDGALSSLRIWTQVRPPTSFFQPSTDRAHLVADYRFMEGSGRDLSPNQNDLTDPSPNLLPFGSYPPQSYSCVASPLDISTGLAVGAIVSVTAASTKAWTVGIFSAADVNLIVVTGTTNLVEIAVDGSTITSMAVPGVTAKAALSIRLTRVTTTAMEVCINDVFCDTVTMSTTAMAYVTVNAAPRNGALGGLQSPCLVLVDSLEALAPLVSSGPTATVDNAQCTFPFAMSIRNCNYFAKYLATNSYNAATFSPLAQAYAIAQLDLEDQACQCDAMPTWLSNFKVNQVDSATPTVTATVDYVKIKTTTDSTAAGAVECAAGCYMLEVVGHRRLDGPLPPPPPPPSPPGPPSATPAPPSPTPPTTAGPTPQPTYPSGNLARKYNVKRDFAFVESGGAWSVLNATDDGVVGTETCLVTGPDTSQVNQALTAFQCQTSGTTTLDAAPPPLAYCILNNTKATCQSDNHGCSLPNGSTTLTSLAGSFSDNYRASITAGVHVCTYIVQPAVPPHLRRFANLSYTIQTADLSANDALVVTDANARPLLFPISGPVAFPDLPIQSVVPGTQATFTLRTYGDKSSVSNDGFVVEFDTVYTFADVATSHFCNATRSVVPVTDVTVFPTSSFSPSSMAFPTLGDCTYVMQAPNATFSSIWLSFLDFTMASPSDRIEVYGDNMTLLASVTNTTFASPHYGVVFNGLADYVLSSYPLPILPASILFWIQVPATLKKDCSVASSCINNVAKRMKVLGTEFTPASPSCARFNVELDVDTGYLSMYLNGATFVLEQDVRQGTWFHIAFVFRELDNDMLGYVNGARVALSTASNYDPLLGPCPSNVLFLGGQPSLPDDRNVLFNGMLRHIVLFTEPKTIYQIGRQMTRKCDATDPTLLLCYAFTTTDTSNVVDDSSVALFGRFHGTTFSTQAPLWLSSLLYKTFTSASAHLVLRFVSSAPNSTFRFIATPKACPVCGDHGVCRRGQCRCDVGYKGPACNVKVDACEPNLVLPSTNGVLLFPSTVQAPDQFVPPFPIDGYPAALDCSWHLRKSSSKMVLLFTELALDVGDSLAVYEGRRVTPTYYATHNLTADLAMTRASYFSRGQYAYTQVIFKNVSSVAATAVLWPVVAAPQPGTCSKSFHIVQFRRGSVCVDGSSVGLNRSWAAQLVSSYWWLQSPEAFSTQITPLQLVFNDYATDTANVTVEYSKLLLGQGKVTHPLPAMFHFRRRTQPFDTCQDGRDVGLETSATIVTATGLHKFTRPNISSGWTRQANVVDPPVFQYAGAWSLDMTKPFSGLFRTPGFVAQVGAAPFTIVVHTTVVLSADVQYLFAQEENNANSIFLKISESRRGLGQWTFGAYASNDRPTAASPASFSRDTVMLAITVNNGVVSYFVNGLLFGIDDTNTAYQACVDQCNADGCDSSAWECRSQVPVGAFNDPSRLVLGGRFQGATVLNAWKGQIFQLTVYDRELSDAVIASLYTGIDAVSTVVSKTVVNSLWSPTIAEVSTIEVLSVPVGVTRVSSTLTRRWQLRRYGCQAPMPSLEPSRLAVLLNVSSLATVVYNALDDTAALVSWSTPTSPSTLVQTSLVRSKLYGFNLTTSLIVDLLVQYGVATDNFPYIVTSVYVNAISATSASIGFHFTDAQRNSVDATATLFRANNTWHPPDWVHRLVVPIYGEVPPSKCRDDRNNSVAITYTSGVLSDGGATESAIVAPNTQCSWLLVAPAGESIFISFTYFHVECVEGEVTIDDMDAHTSTPLCGFQGGYSNTFGANVRVVFRIGSPPTGGPGNHPLPMTSTGFFGMYVFSNDNTNLNTVEVPVAYTPWTIVRPAEDDVVVAGSTKCQLDTTDESVLNPWQIASSLIVPYLDDICYQSQSNAADFEWEVTSHDSSAGDTTTCKDNNWTTDESVPWSAVAIDIVGGTDRYVDPPSSVYHAPAFTYTKSNQSLATTYISERNALEFRVQSPLGGRGRVMIEYYMPQTFYVAPASYQGVDGSNGDGSREKPYTYSFEYLVTNVLASGDMMLLYPGRYEGPGYCNLVMTKAVVIESISGAKWTTLDCNGLSRGWQLKHASGITIVKGLTFTRATVSTSPFTGAAVFASGDVHIEACSFDNNVHRAQGTLAFVSPSVSTVRNCSFTSNVGLSGAAIAVLSASASLDSIQAVDNYATVSGALFVSTYVEGTSMALSSPSRVTMIKSVFVRNKGLKEGAVTITRASVVSMTSNQFTATLGPAIAVDASTLTFDHNLVQSSLGSGIVATNGAVVAATYSTFASNSAKNGAALSLDTSAYQGRSNMYQGNSATVAGGAVFGQACQYTELDSLFVSNVVGNASLGGGALAFTSCNSAVDISTVQVLVQRCTFENNSASFGGAIHLRDVHASIVANQFVGNAAGRFGGAIRVADCMSQRDEVAVNMAGNAFERNVGARGAAVYVETSDVLRLDTNSFIKNAAASFGGAVALVSATRVLILSSMFLRCVASGGGAIYATAESSVDISNSGFEMCSSRSNGGSLYVDNTQLGLTNVWVQGGMASGNGGAIVLMSQGTSIRATNLTISSTSANKGGAFYLIDCSLPPGQVSDVSIVNTSAVTMGGAFYAVLVSMELSRLTTTDTTAASGGMMTLEDSTATLVDSTVAHSTALKNGGAFYVIISTLYLITSLLADNQAINYGGSVYGFASQVTMADSALERSASEFGGGVYVSSSTLGIARSTISSNMADNGGAFYADLSDVHVDESTFDANAATTGGGAAYISSNVAVLTTSVFTNNMANQGGALCLSQVTQVTLDACTFVSNSVANADTTSLPLLGGAVYIDRVDETSTVANCVFQNNSADSLGGAVYAAASTPLLNPPSLLVTNSTFQSNRADSSGGAMFLDGFQTVFDSTSFALNMATRGGGGAIFWQGNTEPVGLPRQSYWANDAVYGPDFASVPVALRPLYTPPPSAVAGQLGGEGSAQPFVGSFVVHVVDKYLQTVATENSIQVTLESTTAGAFVTGTAKVTVHDGVANFTKAGVQQMPGSNATVAVSASGLVALTTVELHIRQCVRGEVTPIGVPQCVKCPFGQFSWNTTDTVCHQCPTGGVCGGGDSIDALDGFWRFENSTGVCTDPSYPYDGCRLGTCLDASCSGYTKGDVSATVRLDGPNHTMILTIRADTIEYRANDTLYVQGEELHVVATEKIGDSTASYQHQVLVTGNTLSTTGAVDIYKRGKEKCKAGYMGNLCFQCAPGYTRSGKTACTSCPANLTLTVVVLVLGVFGVAAVAIVLIIMTINKSRQKADLYSILTKIFTSYLQLVSLAGSFDLQWPQQVKAMFAGQSQISNPGDKLISIECLMDQYKRTMMVATPLSSLSNYYMQLLVFLSLPVCAVVFPMLFWRLRFRLASRRILRRDWGLALNAVLGRGTGTYSNLLVIPAS
ncbi:hypothetical protein, variant 3 [Aphanomyces astaci]|uniref:CUB domain-containing protein n=1 Tax=Aphanomyces astaci TaxID=112090 RepID=W4G460_APHAT|nr:hypothetical protein, variant 3 [Aphanomyces astaci]ETV74475.1 hypothetical protein, variant 3 [Aphanomyces astaci]|eukprot:XP_009836133.1 hypothetical protein, variant 3 [Aphanomyces astaci]